MSNVVRNPQTGEILVVGADGQWQPAQRARNPQTGQEIYYNGNQWLPIPQSPQLTAGTGEGVSGGAAPATTMGSIAQGAFDPIQGGAQLITQSLPSGVVEAVNRATAAVNRAPIIGPITQALGMVPATPEQIQSQTVEREKAYQQSRLAAGDTGIDVPRIGGSLIPATAMALATRNPQSLLGSVAAGGVQGAAMGALEPVTSGQFGEEKIQQTGVGGLLGAVGGPIGYGLGRLIAPQISPGVQQLAAEGVQMTPGQIIGGGARSAESALTSVPFIGPRVSSAINESIQSFDVAAANRALSPIGAKITGGFDVNNKPIPPPAGRDLITTVGNIIGDKYTEITSKSLPLSIDQNLGNDLSRILATPLAPSLQPLFKAELDDVFFSRLRSGPISGDIYKEIVSDIGKLADGYAGSAVSIERKLGDVYKNIRTSLQDWFERINPNLASDLKKADEAYANFARVRQASTSTGAVEGVFTPSQLSSAVRSGDTSVSRGRFARGEALMQDLSDIGRSVLPPTVGDSGTAARTAMLAGLAGGASFGTGALPPESLAALALLYPAYSQRGRQIFQQAMTAPRGPITQAIGTGIASGGGALAQPMISPLVNPRRSLLD